MYTYTIFWITKRTSLDDKGLIFHYIARPIYRATVVLGLELKALEVCSNVYEIYHDINYKYRKKFN